MIVEFGRLGGDIDCKSLLPRAKIPSRIKLSAATGSAGALLTQNNPVVESVLIEQAGRYKVHRYIILIPENCAA